MLPDKTGERRENAGVRPLVKQFCSGILKQSNRNLFTGLQGQDERTLPLNAVSMIQTYWVQCELFVILAVCL